MKRLKFAILWLVGVAALYGGARTLQAAFAGTANPWWLVAWFVVFAASVVLQVGFMSRKDKLIGLLALEGLAPLLVFYPALFIAFSPWVAAGAGACIAYFAFGALRARRFMDNTLEVRLYGMARLLLPKLGMGLLVLFAALAYNYYAETGHFTSETAERLFDGFLKQTEPLVQIEFSNLQFDMRMDTAISVVSEAQLRKLRTGELVQGEGVSELSPQARRALLQELSGEVEQTVTSVGGAFRDDETVSAYLFRVLEAKINALPDIARFFLAVAFGVLVFVMLRITLPVLYPVAGFLAFAVFKLLLLTPFTAIASKETKKQVITL